MTQDADMPTFGELRSWTEAGQWDKVFEHVTPDDPETWEYAWSKYSRQHSLAEVFAEGMHLDDVIWNPVEFEPPTLLERMASYLLPVVNRVFPSLVADEMVRVQPMSSPAGTIFFADWEQEPSPEPGEEE